MENDQIFPDDFEIEMEKELKKELDESGLTNHPLSNSLARGFRKGYKQGYVEETRRLELNTLRSLHKNMDISFEQAMDLLEVPDILRGIYLDLLNEDCKSLEE